MNDTSATGSIDWPADIFSVFQDQQIAQVAHVPDAGHSRLLKQCEAARDMRVVPLSTEEEGIALLGGAWLGGQRGVLLMQSSGVGNCVNQFSLVRIGRFPFVTLVTMRGEFGEQNAWQIPMGQGVVPAMEGLGMHCLHVDRPEDVIPTTTAALGMAYKSNAGVGILLGQKLIGAKEF